MDVVIVSYERSDLLLRCCASVRHHAPAARMIVVDNASTDGSASTARRDFPEALVLENERNLGFGTAVNRGVAAGDGQLILLLNSDAELAPGSLETLVATLDREPRAAGCGPRLSGPSGDIELSIGRTMSPASELFFKILEPLYGGGAGPLTGVVERFYAQSRRTRFLTAACLLLRREAFEEVGGMDERFFLYAEDVDLCMRLSRAGWHFRYTPDAEIEHQRGASAGVRPLQTELAYRASQLELYRKHRSSWVAGALRIYLCARYALASLLARGKRREHARAMLAWFLEGGAATSHD